MSTQLKPTTVSVIEWVEGSPTTGHGVTMLAALCDTHSELLFQSFPSACGTGRRYEDVCDFCAKNHAATERENRNNA